MGSGTCWAVMLLAMPVGPQQGDVAGEAQSPLPAAWSPPASPARSAVDQLGTFVAADGLVVELVAAEPLVEAPVQAVFDGDGRLWVVEMRGYMRDVDGSGERAPIGRVSVLHDDDGDGRMDRATRFLEGLVLPRSVAPTRGGALVIAPPHVLFCRDTDGDGVADERAIVDSGIAGLASPEYGPNGLLPTLDNAFHCARHDLRYRFVGDRFVREPVAAGGQWGIDEDADGTLFFDTNSHVLRAHSVPPREAAANPFLDSSALVDVALATDHSVRPIRATTAVNRAYRDGWLVDGRITRADAVCGVLVGPCEALPAEFARSVLVCEPAGNLVHELVLAPGDGAPRAAPRPGARAFLASTDERFRPVNLARAPDGALIVVDLYRGLIQHRQFLTTFLRNETLARGLVEPLDRGRIWRVRAAGAVLEPVPRLSALSSDELIAVLAHRSTFLRRAAQRAFVEDDWDEAVVLPKLAAVATGHASADARIHALWALDGRGALDERTLVACSADPDPRVRLQALRAATFRPSMGEELLAAIAGDAHAARAEPEGLLRQRLAALALLRDVRADALAWERARGRLASRAIRHALLLGAAGRGLELLSVVLADGSSRAAKEDERALLLHDLARSIAREGRAADVLALLESASAGSASVTTPLLEGCAAGRASPARRLQLAREPAGLAALAAGAAAGAAPAARRVLEGLAWPGRADVPAEQAVAPLTGADLGRFERGRALYAEVCAACHQAGGRGAPGIAPPLVDSPRLLGDPARAAAIVLAGLRGPLTAGGRDWDLEMPAWNAADEDVAAVLTYARREWGQAASPVGPDDVRRARARVLATPGPLDARLLERFGATSPLDGWRTIGDAQWSLEDGAIRGRVGGGAQSFLASERTYGDFVLEADVKLLGTGNSGIQVRSRQRPDGRVVGYQFEVDPSERAWSGGLYDEARRGWLQDLAGNAAGRAALRRDDWNRFRIECQGLRLRAWVNGVVTADWIDPLDLEGFVALQVHSGRTTDLLWRDLAIEDRGRSAWCPLEPEAAFQDGSLRVTTRARDATIVLRDGAFEGEPRDLAPGVTLERGVRVRVAELALPAARADEPALVLVVSVHDDVLAIHAGATLVGRWAGIPLGAGAARVAGADAAERLARATD
ncbi:MAG: DUF1080 domain-containing protein [Planctomycetes bacterium]|nr:DUF1080 domain-containing protein [Planctomycetota bacterium]